MSTPSASKLASEEDLDRAAFYFARKGLPTSFPEMPYQGRTLRTVDAIGMPIDFYARMDQSESMLRKYAEYKGARIQRIDHINCFTPDVQASYDFYTDIGFRLTEYTETDGDDAKLWAVWMHRKGNVHDLAFTNGRGPRLHHIGVWTAGPLDILHICDVMASSGFLANMERGPGRHGISNAFFLYIRDPDGHRVELFTSDYLTVDPDFEPLRWSLQDPQRQTLWGHPAPKSWFEEGSTLYRRALARAGIGGAADRRRDSDCEILVMTEPRATPAVNAARGDAFAQGIPMSVSNPATEPTRRDFLYVATAAVGTVGALATLIPLISQMEPDKATIAAGAPISVDLSRVSPGQQIQVFWRSKPILIVNRPPAALKMLQERQASRSSERPELRCAPATALCEKLASLDQAGIRRVGRHLHPSRLYSEILSRPEPVLAGGRLAGRLFLPLPRLEIRSRRPRLQRRTGAVQSPGAALSLRERHDAAHRRKPARRQLQPRQHSTTLDRLCRNAG